MNSGIESIIPEKEFSINSFFRALSRFIGSAFLASILTRPITMFIDELNKNGVLSFGSDFSAEQMIWEGGVFPNIFRIVISLYTGSLFGFFFGYFSKRISQSKKILVSIIFPFLGFIIISIFSYIISFISSDLSEIYNSAIFLVFKLYFGTILNSILISLNILVLILGCYYFIRIGQNVRNDEFQIYDKDKSGTLLDIKWFHYLWLQIPIHAYFISIIIMCYLFIISTINLFSDFPFQLIEYGSSFFFRLILLISIIGGIFYLLTYLRELIIGKIEQHWAIKVLLIILISIVIPLIIILFAFSFI